MNPLSESSCNCSDNSFILDGANRYGARATGAAPGIKSIWNSTGQAGGSPDKSSGNTSGKSRTIVGTMSIRELNVVDIKLLSAPVSNKIDV
ncbi:hypothetical protein Tco_1164330 [Tanacetum coccineum]